MFRIEFHPEAEHELADARQWYADRDMNAARRFAAEIEKAVAAILAGPDMWPKIGRRERDIASTDFPTPWCIGWREKP